MKAAVLEKYGDADAFVIKEKKRPECERGQLLIRNKASSVNPIDTIVRSGKAKLFSGLFGEHIIGADFAGVVIDSNSDHFDEGDEVFGFQSALKGGMYAEEVIVDEDHAVLKPANISFTEAASLPLVSLTAWQGMVEDGKMKKGDNIIITGCTGGVGTVAVQMALYLGAHVTGVCSTKHVEAAKALGCHEVIDYETQPIRQEHQYDLFFDAAGKYKISDMHESLKPEAHFVTTRGGAKDFGSTLVAAYEALIKRMKIVMVKPEKDDLLKLKRLVEEGVVTPHVAKVFPLTKLADAHRMLENESFVGKVAIEI